LAHLLGVVQAILFFFPCITSVWIVRLSTPKNMFFQMVFSHSNFSLGCVCREVRDVSVHALLEIVDKTM